MKSAKLLFLLLAIFVAGCVALPAKTVQQECPDVIPTPAPTPDFLNDVIPNGIIKKAEYDQLVWYISPDDPLVALNGGGIEVTIFASGKLGTRDTLGKSEITLIVDEIIFKGDPSSVRDGLEDHGPFWLVWAMDLNLGYHNATLRFDLYTGEAVTYSWNFCIIP